MSEKIRKLVLFSLVYGLIFWIGFKSGVSYNRIKNKIAVEKIIIEQEPQEPQPKTKILKIYYIVEKYNYGNHSQATFREESESGLTMKFFFNKNLRPLLKLRDIKIYTSKGERIY